MLNRRQLLATVAIAPLAAACSSGGTTVPTWVAAIQAIGQEAALIMPQLVGAGLSGAAATAAQAVITQIENAAAAVSAAATATAGQSILVQIEGYINALAPIVTPFVSLIPGGAAIGLIVAALPAIELAVNLLVSLLSPQAQALAASAPAPAAAGRFGAAARLTPQEALAELLRVTGH